MDLPESLQDLPVVEVIRSRKRRKTIEMRVTEKGFKLYIPAHSTHQDEAEYVSQMLGRWERRKTKPPLELPKKAALLAREFGLRRPEVIKWVDNQTTRWASCTPSTQTIRVSTVVAKFPTWVIDYVIIHELAHLEHAGHGRNFWAAVERYPLTERARGFLIARGLDSGVNADGEDPGATRDAEIDLTDNEVAEVDVN